MPKRPREPHQIDYMIVGDSGPGSQWAIIDRASEYWREGVDLVRFPLEAVRQDAAGTGVLFNALCEMMETYVGLHHLERVRFVGAQQFMGLFANLAEYLRSVAVSMQAEVEVRVDTITPVPINRPSARVYNCGDGRGPYQRGRIHVINQCGGVPECLTPPGGMLWLRDRPVADRLLSDYYEQFRGVPRIVVHHNDCGYRRLMGYDPTSMLPEMEYALFNECAFSGISGYYWLTGNDEYPYIEPMQPRLSAA